MKLNPFFHELHHFAEIIEKLQQASYHYADDSTREWGSGSTILTSVVEWMADNEWTRWELNRFFRLCADHGHEFLISKDDLLDRLINVYVLRSRR